MSPDQEVQLTGESAKGARTNALLQSGEYRDAMAAVENAILEAWKTSPIRDVEGQTMLRLKLKCLHEVQSLLNDYVETGKLATIQLSHERGLKQRARDAMRAFSR